MYEAMEFFFELRSILMSAVYEYLAFASKKAVEFPVLLFILMDLVFDYSKVAG